MNNNQEERKRERERKKKCTVNKRSPTNSVKKDREKKKIERESHTIKGSHTHIHLDLSLNQLYWIPQEPDACLRPPDDDGPPCSFRRSAAVFTAAFLAWADPMSHAFTRAANRREEIF